MKKYLHKESVWPSVDYCPHIHQQKVHACSVRNRWVACGRRWGKSTLGGMELIPEALLSFTQKDMLESQGRYKWFWIVGPNYDDSEKEWRVFYDRCKKIELPFDKPGTYNDPNGGNMRMSLWDGRFIVEAKSAKHEDSLDGEGLSGVMLVEAAKLKEKIYSKFIRPSLSDYHGWLLGTSTPEGKNWFYDMCRRGWDPARTDTMSWRMPSWTNPIIFPGGEEDPEIVALRGDMREANFNQEIGAQFEDFVGAVFKEWDEETHVTDCEYDPRLEVVAAVDYGYRNPFVWLVLQKDRLGVVRVLHEYRTHEQDIEDIAIDLSKTPYIDRIKRFYPDPASPESSAYLSKKLHMKSMGGTGGEIKERVRMIGSALKLRPAHAPIEDRAAQLYIDRSCTGLIYEMGEYRYPDQKSEIRPAAEEPLKKDDHGPEALGRFYAGESKSINQRRARVSSAR